MTPVVYLAGPEVFHPEHSRIFAEREAMCRQYGLKAVVPIDNMSVTAIDIYRMNVKLLESCHAVIANISPFRGPHCDVGTAWEVGYAVARQTPVFAFSETRELLFERVVRDSRRPVDDFGMLVEDFGLPENLMIALSLVGSTVHGSFERALRAVAEYLRSSPKVLEH